jgi:hypothetical protein
LGEGGRRSVRYLYVALREEVSGVVAEARLGSQDSGLAPVSEGWFVVNVRDAAWETNDQLGAMCAFESADVPFAQLGVNLRVLRPGGSGLYHAESTQEAFLVLAGQCLLPAARTGR